MAGFWEEEKLIGRVSKNDKGDEIQVRIVKQHGKKFTDVRTFYIGKDGQLKPSKGIVIPDDLVDEVAGMMIEGGKE